MRALAPLVLLVMSSLAAAQSSPSFEITSIGLTRAGGGVSTTAGAHAFVALPNLSGDEIASTNFRATFGFLAANDAAPPLQPIVYGVDPFFGPDTGGTPVTIVGVNFDLFGSAATIMVDFDGVLATGVTVVSDTTITCATPAGAMGPLEVTVSSSQGTDVFEDGFVNTPAIVISKSAMLGAPTTLTTYGKVTDIAYSTFGSTNTTMILVPPFGTLLIGPAPLFMLIVDQPFITPGVPQSTVLQVPPMPGLSGILLHVQSMAWTSLAPLVGILTNRSTMQLY